jgi:hypothetical protein
MNLFQGVYATLWSGRWLCRDLAHLRLIMVAANMQAGFKLDRLIFDRIQCLRNKFGIPDFAQIGTIILGTNPVGFNIILRVLKNHIKLFLVQLEAGNV